MKTELQRIITNLELNPIPGRRQLTVRILTQLHELQKLKRTAPVVEDKLKCPKCSSEDILTGDPDWAKEFPEVECNSCGECWTPCADTSARAGMGAVVVAARKFLNDANSAWAAGEPLHKVRTMLDAADDLQAALDALQPGEAQGAVLSADEAKDFARPLPKHPYDEQYDCQSDVERDPCGAWMAIQHMAHHVATPPAAQVTVADLERIATDFEKDSNLERHICCNGHDCGCQAATAGQYAAYQIRLAIRALAGEA